MRSDQQRRGDLRTTVLVPEAIIPHETARRPRWGLWMATLLAGMIAGLGLAWSFGFTRNQLKGHEAPLEASTPLPAPTPQSPYPSDLPDLSGRSTAPPAPSPPPVAPPELVPETPPVAVAPARPRELPEQRPPAPTPPPVTKIARLRPAPPTPVATHVEKPVPSERRSSPPTLPTPPTPPTPTERVDAAPRSARSLVGPLSGLFVPNDYPATARRAGEQGDVTVRLAIGADGRPSRCRLLASNASRALQAATCAVLLSRARFAAATDSHGSATSDAVVQHVAWRLP